MGAALFFAQQDRRAAPFSAPCWIVSEPCRRRSSSRLGQLTPRACHLEGLELLLVLG